MHLPILADIAIIFGLSVVALYICHKLKIPGIIGFLLTGVLAGSHGLGLISADQEVEVLAEIGVILLLFAIGIEFSLRSLIKIKRSVLLGGAFQVVLTISATAAISYALNFTLNEAIFLGFLVSLSSTAIVLKALQDRAEIDSPYGRTTLAILIFQDIVIVVMMLATPMLSATSETSVLDVALILGKGVGVVLFVLLAARYLVPGLLNAVVGTRSRELFLLTIAVLCFTTAWLTSQAGLSLALGAFLAGLIISESEYSHQAMGNILPFRDIFTSLFFVSVGMLLDSVLFIENLFLILAITTGVIILKLFAACTAVYLLGLPLRVALLTGLALSQVGEFSFILSKVGLEYNLLTENTYGIILAVSVLTMGATPFIIQSAPRISALVLRLPLPERVKAGFAPVASNPKDQAKKKLDSHLVIVGYGLNGSNVARAARRVNAAYTIIELNPELVQHARKANEPVYFGDATNEGVLEHAGISTARTVAIVISDAIATRRIVATIRQLNPSIHIIARTRFVSEMEELYRLGADQVIPEEYETSVEIFTRVLQAYDLPQEEIREFSESVRAEGYEMLRSSSTKSGSKGSIQLGLPQMETESLRVEAGSESTGSSLAQLNIRQRFGVTVLAVRRGSEVIPNPNPNDRLQANDIVMLLGTTSQVHEAASLFKNVE